MKANLILILSIFVFASCVHDENIKHPDFQGMCYDSSKVSGGGCPYVYAPVCGCDYVTYGNACIAEKNGIVSYVRGTCDSLSLDL